MPSSYTSNAGFEKPADGEQNNSWGDTVNDNMDILDRLTSQVGSIALASTTYTLTTSTSGAVSEGHYSVIKFTGSPGGTCTVTISPNSVQRIYTIYNASDQTVTMTQGSGGNVSIAAGAVGTLYCDGAGSGAAVVSINESPASNVLLDADINSTVQAYDVDLSAIGALAKTDGNFIVGNGSTWVAESGNTALTSLGVTATGTELNKLDGVTWTLTDYNTLTATAAELNLLDGVTWTLTDYNALTATATELNLLDGVTAKTGADTTLVTGTAGSEWQIAVWNADGDIIGYTNTFQNQATWEAGTSTTESLVTPAKVKAAIEALSPFSESFTSTEQTLTAGGTLNLAHGLSATPSLVQGRLVCKVSDRGYSVGDEIIAHLHVDAQDSSNQGIGVYVDATNVNVIFGSTSYIINALDKSTGARGAITPSSWRLVIRAWA